MPRPYPRGKTRRGRGRGRDCLVVRPVSGFQNAGLDRLKNCVTDMPCRATTPSRHPRSHLCAARFQVRMRIQCPLARIRGLATAFVFGFVCRHKRQKALLIGRLTESGCVFAHSHVNQGSTRTHPRPHPHPHQHPFLNPDHKAGLENRTRLEEQLWMEVEVRGLLWP
uniref:HDC00430 n=1 Tax=Drosophila melanogaster TaxID=7227 RepID=Q6IHX3_DROME|nr:TPA_inf: HDC00430 [Drosophila melanogaster]